MAAHILNGAFQADAGLADRRWWVPLSLLLLLLPPAPDRGNVGRHFGENERRCLDLHHVESTVESAASLGSDACLGGHQPPARSTLPMTTPPKTAL